LSEKYEECKNGEGADAVIASEVTTLRRYTNLFIIIIIIIIIVGRPFDSVLYVDIIWPLVETQSHKRFILSMGDMATKFCETVSLKFCDSQSVAEALFKIFKNFGGCKRIHSNREPCFVSGDQEQKTRMERAISRKTQMNRTIRVRC